MTLLLKTFGSDNKRISQLSYIQKLFTKIKKLLFIT